MRSITYWHPFIYQAMMRLIYGPGYRRGQEIVGSLVEPSWKVLDVCCGDGAIKRFLDPSVVYVGLDVIPTFIRWGKNRGFDLRLCDVSRRPWIEDSFDCVIMLRSLCHFIPHHREVVDEMFRLANKRVVIVEPAENLTDSSSPLVAYLARKLSDPGVPISEKRFNRESILELFKDYGSSRVIDVGRDLIGVFDLTP